MHMYLNLIQLCNLIYHTFTLPRINKYTGVRRTVFGAQYIYIYITTAIKYYNNTN